MAEQGGGAAAAAASEAATAMGTPSTSAYPEIEGHLRGVQVAYQPGADFVANAFASTSDTMMTTTAPCPCPARPLQPPKKRPYCEDDVSGFENGKKMGGPGVYQINGNSLICCNGQFYGQNKENDDRIRRGSGIGGSGSFVEDPVGLYLEGGTKVDNRAAPPPPEENFSILRHLLESGKRQQALNRPIYMDKPCMEYFRRQVTPARPMKKIKTSTNENVNGQSFGKTVRMAPDSYNYGGGHPSCPYYASNEAAGTAENRSGNVSNVDRYQLQRQQQQYEMQRQMNLEEGGVHVQAQQNARGGAYGPHGMMISSQDEVMDDDDVDEDRPLIIDECWRPAATPEVGVAQQQEMETENAFGYPNQIEPLNLSLRHH